MRIQKLLSLIFVITLPLLIHAQVITSSISGTVKSEACANLQGATYFNPNFGLNQYSNKPWAYSDYLSRWSMRIGWRYSF